jgi:lipopolysaccharide transport system ATP-binding protein
MSDAIVVDGVSKRFLLPSIPKGATVKDFVIRTIRRDGNRDGYVDALRNVSFTVEKGKMLGVIGRNGSGKTTMMRVIAGILQPDSGSVRVEGHLAPLLTLATGFHPDLTGREGAHIELLALGFSRAEVKALIPQIIEFSEIGEFVDAPVRMYSSGMMMRLAFSVAVSVDADILMFDEILAVGDVAFAQKCLNCIEDFRTRGKTIVLVTHDTNKVMEWCDLALWLEQGEVAGLGPAASVVHAYGAAAADRIAHTP